MSKTNKKFYKYPEYFLRQSPPRSILAAQFSSSLKPSSAEDFFPAASVSLFWKLKPMENAHTNFITDLDKQNGTSSTLSPESPSSPSESSSISTWRQFCQSYPPRFLHKVTAEIIATYLLVFVTCGSAALSGSDEQKVSKLGASVAGGLIVTVMIYAVGHISGAHMNPAVTFAFAVVGHFPWKQVPLYAFAQLTGATSAAFTLRILLHPIKHVGTTSPSGTEIQALITEIVVTFSMMFVTSAVATDTKAIGELAGLAVGSAVCITSILAGPISGGSMNPARTIGPAIASDYYSGIWVYIVGPVCGTLAGAWTYNFIRETDKPVHAISNSLSFKQRCMRSQNNQHMLNEDLFNPV